MQWIDFLLNNPLVIAGLIFAVSSLFGKKARDKKAEAQRDRKRKPATVQNTAAPHRAEAEKPGRESFEEAKDRMKEAVKTIEARYQSAKSTLPNADEDAASRNVTEIKEQADLFVQQTAQKAPAAPKKTPAAARDDIVRGIIWSEIIGPPRSKKPHRAARRQL
ncbi:hypothetical protein SLL00_19895 [Metabacillus indicus]|uniref:hypothetical protein n=1 Tax=Metabacillus indicus TaxID=246786 RepID=UPI002A07A74E|nr:hypothetical protein [Metabacillus indicus]MDX8292082.1 hypothetical protein [Metabacillus indicus]